MQVTEYGYTVKAQCVSGRGYVDASERSVVKLELICQNDDYKRWFAGNKLWVVYLKEHELWWCS